MTKCETEMFFLSHYGFKLFLRIKTCPMSLKKGKLIGIGIFGKVGIKKLRRNCNFTARNTRYQARI